MLRTAEATNGKLKRVKQILVKISRKIVTFFQNLEKVHKKSDFQWTPEAEEAFKQMKKLIAELPTLTAPREHEELIIYLAAAKECKQTVEKILPSTHGRCNNRSTNKATVVKFGNIRKNAEMEVRNDRKESPGELIAEPEVLPEPWTLFTDGSSCVDGSGAGLILTNPEGAEFTMMPMKVSRFESTNNESE
ncbi:hypothetical protein Tco_0112092 [Tanacetum coccineum]